MLWSGSETVQGLRKFKFQKHFMIFLPTWPGVARGEGYSSGLVGLEGSSIPFYPNSWVKKECTDD